jgi:probable rRNA maturation factor
MDTQLTRMNIYIDIQHAHSKKLPIDDQTLIDWAKSAVLRRQNSAELTLRIVDIDEITQLNHQYRKHNKATNVLAFPASIPAGITLDVPFLGDIIICASVVEKESIELHKPLDAHWALMVIHGVLHLLGYDHIEDNDAIIMQAIEIELLATMGFNNPYQTEEGS